MNPMHRRARLILAVVVIWFALLTGMAWAAGSWNRPHQARFDVPVGPGRALHMHVVGAPVRLYIEPGPSPITRPGSSLQVSVWYRPLHVHPGTYVGTFPLPAWPLAVLTGGLSIALFGVSKWVRRRPAATLHLE